MAFSVVFYFYDIHEFNWSNGHRTIYKAFTSIYWQRLDFRLVSGINPSILVLGASLARVEHRKGAFVYQKGGRRSMYDESIDCGCHQIINNMDVHVSLLCSLITNIS